MQPSDGTAPEAETWPFHGRAAEAKAAVAGFTTARGVLVFGDGGVGKSRLVAEVTSRLDGGAPWHRVVASRGIASVALGAWAHLLPPGWDGRPEDVSSWRAVAHHLAGDGPARLLVEDAHWLDPASAALLHHLVGSGQALAAVTSRRDPAPAQPITALWKDGHLARIDLEPLAGPVVAELLEAALGGPVEPRTTERLHQRAGGNPLLVRELVEDARRAGRLRLVHGAWVEEHAGRPGPRLVDLLADRVEDLALDERAGLEVLALAAPIAAELLARSVGSAVRQRLIDRGLARVEQDGLRRSVAIADPLVAEVLVERMVPGRRTEILDQLVRLYEEAELLDDAERLRPVVWRLDLGRAIDVEEAMRAADAASLRNDFGLAERLAVAAEAAGGGAAATVRRGEALMHRHDHLTAEAVLAPVAGRLGELDDDLRFRYANARAVSLGREVGRLDDAIGVLEDTIPTMADDRSRWALEAHLAFLLADCGRLGAARPLAEARLAAASLDGPSALTAMVPSALISTLGGRCHDTLALCERMLPVAIEHLEARPEALGWIAAAQMLATFVSGDLAASVALTEAFDLLVADDPDPTLRAGILMSRGLAAAEQGRLDTGLRFLQQAAALHEVDNRRGYQSWTFAITARVRAQRGEVAEAAAALEAARRHAWPGGQVFDSDLYIAAIWVAMLQGDRAGAAEVLDRALAWTATEQMPTTEIGIRHEAVRAGLQARPHAAPIAALAEHEQSRWGRLQAAHVVALAAGDGPALVDVANGLSELGVHLQAAETYAQAVGAHQRAGAMGSAASAAQLSREARSRCEAPATPGLRMAGTVDELTEREADVARLAVAGRSNHDIAEVLGISVRTAETHLQRAYAKLGIHRRSELAEVLGAAPR